MNEVLTLLTPALILLVMAIGTRFFPPSQGNAFLVKGSTWWSRDAETWKKAYRYLARTYALLGGLLTMACSGLVFVKSIYAPYIGFALLFLCFIVAHGLTRTYMKKQQ